MSENHNPIIDIHSPGKTLIPWFNGLHCHIHSRSQLYRSWHSKKYHKLIHWLTLGIYIIGIISIIPWQIGFAPTSKAASYSKTWTSQTDWGDWTLSSTSKTITDGSVSLSYTAGSTANKSVTLPARIHAAGGGYNPNDGKIYYFGGANSSDAYVTTIVAYDPATDTTQTKAAVLPSARGWFAGVVWDTSRSVFYLFGGDSDAGRKNSILQYNPATDSLTSKTMTLPAGRGYTSATWNPNTNKAYILGGYTSSTVNSIIEYDPSLTDTGTATTKSETLPFAANRMASAWSTSDNKIYIFGGIDSSNVYRTDIISYDPATGTVSNLCGATCLPSPKASDSNIAVWDSDQLVFKIYGGITTAGAFTSSIFQYAPLTSTVSTLSETLPANRGHQVTAYSTAQKKTYLIGGRYNGTGANYYNTVVAHTSNPYNSSGTANITYNPVPGSSVTWASRTLSTTLNSQTVTEEYSINGTDYGTFATIAANQTSQNLYVRLTLSTSNTDATPLVDSLVVSYSINSAPTASVTSASQGSDGNVTVNYTISDPEEGAGNPSPDDGTVAVTLEYSTNGGSSWNSATGATGHAGTVSGITSSSADKTLSWDPSNNSITSYYSAAGAQFKIRLSLNDGNTVNNTATATSSAFELDKAVPTTPTNSSPSNASYTTDTTPTLQGSAYTDDTTQTAGQFQVSTTSGNYSSPTVDQTASAGDMTQYTTSALTDNTYYWHIRYKDSKGNWSAYSTESSFTLDTVTPGAPTNIKLVDASIVTDSTYQHYLTWTADNDTNFKDYLVKRSTNGTDYSTVSTIATSATNYYLDLSLSNNTTYYYKVTVEDQVNSPATSSVVSNQPGSADTTAPTFSSISTGTPGTNTATITWTTNESSNSLVDWGTTTSYGTTSGKSTDSVTSHSVTLSRLNPDTTYYARIRSRDGSGNEGTSDNSSAGYSFVTLSAPTITSVATSSTITTITVTWTTDTASNSLVDYGTTTSYGSTAGNAADAVTSHSVTITNLTASTTYKLRVRSQDAYLNEETDDNSGTGYSKSTASDTTAPTISSVSSSNVNNTSATISWTTNEQATGTVSYSTTSGFSFGSGTSVSGATSADTQTHTVQLTGLTRNTTYYYLVRSLDSSSNTTTATQESLTTTGDNTGPVISSGSATNTGETTTDITWVTDEPASSSVALGTTAGSYTISAGSDSKLDRNHRISVTGLANNTKYYIKLTSADSNSNSTDLSYADDATLTFTTQSTPTVSTETVSDITSSTVTIGWTSNNSLDSYVEYGTTTSYGYQQGSDTDTTTHSVTLTGLSATTKYYYRIRSVDMYGNLATGTGGSFTTISATVAVTDSVAPTITGLGPQSSVEDISATITWVTNENSNSIIRYGTGTDYGKETGLDDAVTNHSVNLVGLSPNTTYNYQVRSKDSSGNTGASDNATFITKEKSIIQNVTSSNVALDSAIVTWETTTATTSNLNYGTATSFGQNITDQSLGSTTKHTIKLNNLNSGTLYYYQVTGTDQFGKTVNSDTYNFTTLTLPVVSSTKILEVQATQANIAWNTNIPTNSTVNYGIKSTSEHSQGAANFVTDHLVTLVGLEPKTTYLYAVTGTDNAGHTAQSQSGTFTTKSDVYPPVISNLITESSTIGAGDASRIQLIVSWTTDEPTTSEVRFGSGVSGETLPETSGVNTAYDTSHIVIIKNLKPSTTYRLNALSSDKSNNNSKSQQYTVLTPPKQVSVLQVIVSTLEDTFSFIPKLFNQNK